MKKILSTVLLIAMLATLFCACSQSGSKLHGTWEAEIDLTSSLLDGIKDSFGDIAEEVMASIEIKDLKIKSQITFNEDGSYIASIDSDSVNAVIKSLGDQLASGLQASLTAEEGADAETIATVISDVRAAFDEEFDEASVAAIVQSYSKSGYYKAEDNKLYTADTAENLDAAGFEAYELAKNTLTLSKGEGHEDVYSEMIQSFYPLVYTRKDK